MVLRRIPGKGVLKKLSSFALVISAGVIYIGENAISQLKNIKPQELLQKMHMPVLPKEQESSIRKSAVLYDNYLKELKNKF